MTTWLDAAGVAAITGFTPTTPQLTQAQAVIDIYSNCTTAASAGLSKRDLNWLGQALAWQATWMPSQPGYAQRRTAERVSQDGLDIRTRSQSEQMLAPLAERALRNLSWKASRTTRMPVVGTRPNGLFLQDYTQERSDELHAWAQEQY